MSLITNNPYRHEFPVLNQEINGHKVVYLDSGATTLKPLEVINEIDLYYRNETSNVHRGLYWLSENATTKFEATRDKDQNLINTRDRIEMIFTKGTTYAVNLVASSYVRTFLKKDVVILLSQLEHHSILVPWELAAEGIGAQIKVIPINQDG